MRCLITGINGQDSSYLAELMLSLGYEVHGIIKRSSKITNISDIKNKIHIHVGDITDSGFMFNLINNLKPNEIYNLAGQSHVGYSFDCPRLTIDVNGIAVLNILEAVVNMNNECKIFQASTSELFDGKQNTPYNENSKFSPVSPYGVSKLQAHNLIKVYRESYGMFCCNGISFNHESPRRGDDFVTKKIINWFKEGFDGYMRGTPFKPLMLGNINAIRDWGHAQEYVEAFYLMLQNKTPTDYVISTGECFSVKNIIETCLSTINKNVVWETTAEGEVGKVDEIPIVISSKKRYRPVEVDHLCGDNTKIKQELGWIPTKNINDIIMEMLYD